MNPTPIAVLPTALMRQLSPVKPAAQSKRLKTMTILDINTRYELAEKIAKQWTDNADLKEIESYFFNSQFEYLNDLPDDELLDVAKDQGVQL